MVQRGVLGNITVIDSEHGWAVNAGEILGCLCLAQLSTHSGAGIYEAEEVQAQLSRLQQVLNAKGIGWTASAQYNRAAMEQLFNAVSVQIKKYASPTHCACLYLGLATKIMQESIILVSTDPEVAQKLGSLARSKLDDIDRLCSGIHIAPMALYEVLQQRYNGTKSGRELFRELSSPLIILFALADPRGGNHLRLLQEKPSLEEALRQTRYRDVCIVHDVPSCRVQDLSPPLLRHKPQILHFSGHGGYDGLVYEDVLGNPQKVDATALASLLSICSKRHGLEAVILNACYSDTQAQPIADAVGSVIAVNLEISDDAAIAFSTSFYNALGEGMGFDETFEWARATTAFETSSTEARPVLIKKRDDQ